MDADTQGRRLRIARMHANYATAGAAADHFHWNINTYKSHENDIRGLRPKAAEKYAKAFKCQASWLLTGEGTAPGAKVLQFDRAGFRAAVGTIIDADRSIAAGFPRETLIKFAESIYERYDPKKSTDAWELVKGLVEGALLSSPAVPPPPIPSKRKPRKS